MGKYIPSQGPQLAPGPESHEGRIDIICPTHHYLLQNLEKLLVSAVDNDLLLE